MASRSGRRTGVTAWLAVALVGAACSGGTDDDEAAGSVVRPAAETSSNDTATRDVVTPIEASPPDVAISGLAIARGEEVAGAPEPLVDVEEIISGGPPPDGIPSIDEPRFLQPDEVDFLSDNEPVVALEIDGDARAYPVQIMTWHEIVNDTVGGVPVAVTYCPLCNSAVAYDRRVEDLVMEFGTSGMLWNSALVMYDRQTETLWSHFTGEGIVGELTGVELDVIPMATISWADWRDANPDGLVLSRETGFAREYGRNPYPGYDDLDGRPFLFQGEVDGRYTAMTRLVGIEVDGRALAVPLVALEDERVVAGDVGGLDVVVFWAPGTASALDTPQLAEGDDVGATGVFVPEIDGRALTFTASGDGFVDEQTGSTWNLLGEAVAGELQGARLEPVAHVDTFWFAWAAFRPDTEIVGG